MVEDAVRLVTKGIIGRGSRIGGAAVGILHVPLITPWDMLINDAIVAFISSTCPRPRMLRR